MINTDFPKFDLGFLPTPLVELKNLSKYLSGPHIFMKRDDMTGLAFGGNKTRKLEYLLGEALFGGYDTLITGGAEQSNHCRQTAAAAAFAGLECHLVLSGNPPDDFNGNLLLNRLCKAQIHWAGDFRKGETIPSVAEDLRSKGKKPYTIPYGGSNVTGALGFVEAAEELSIQMSEKKLRFDRIVFASSSGGTHAGLMVGAEIYGLDSEITGIAIDKEGLEEGTFGKMILDLTNETALKLDISKVFTNNDIILKNGYTGNGYGVAGKLEKEAISLLASLEGVFLDPVYTGRAMGGLIDMIRKKEITEKERVLFWHTGGTPALFSYAFELMK